LSHIDEQEAQHHDEERTVEEAREVELQQRRGKRRRRRHDAGEFRKAKRNAQHGHRQHADQRRADDAAGIERGDQDEAHKAKHGRRRRKIAERHER
jgi:hypothetical protein